MHYNQSKMGELSKCEVCFHSIPAQYVDSRTVLLSCRVCQRTAHKFCYKPCIDKNQEKNFQCDVCKQKKNQKSKNAKISCHFCLNDGLLKKSVNGVWGHPICFMIAENSLVSEYKTLQFYTWKKASVKGRKHQSQDQCIICQNITPGYLHKCFNSACDCKAHLYCIFKNIGAIETSNEDQPRWNQDLRIAYKGTNLDYFKFTQQKFKRFIKNYCPPAFKCLFGDRKVMNISPTILVYCPLHQFQYINCYCINVDSNEEVNNWINCDCCGKWYHFSCENIQNPNQLDQLYQCKPCQKYHASLADTTFWKIQVFPKLYFYDFVNFQIFCQSKRYLMNSQLEEFLSLVPFPPSARYMQGFHKQKIFNPKLLKSITLNGLKKKLDKMEITSLDETFKTPKAVIEIFLKIDLLVGINMISAIQKFTKSKYTFKDILSLVEKYDKMYSKQSNISKDLIKKLKALRNIESLNEQEEELSKDQKQEMSRTAEQLKSLFGEMKQLLKMQDSAGMKVLFKKFYTLFNENAKLKQAIKIYIEKGFDVFGHYSPFLKYKNIQDMQHQNLLKTAYQTFIEEEKKKFSYSLSLQTKILDFFKIAKICSEKVQKNNTKIIRSMKQKLSGKKNQQYITNETYMQGQMLKSIKTAKFLQQIKKLRLEQKMKLMLDKKLQQIGDKLELNCLQIAQHYYTVYDQCMKMLKNFPEGRLELEMSSSNLDLIAKIGNISVNKKIMTNFIHFFINIGQINFSALHPSIEEGLKSKGLEILDQFKNKKIGNELELKLIKVIVLHLKVQNEKFKSLCLKEQDIFKGEENWTLEQNTKIAKNIQLLRKMKQFCVQQGLQFRTPKLEYCQCLILTYEQAFKYFPLQLFVRHNSPIAKQYLEINPKQETTVDYYLLKKYMYKLKMVKFPQDTTIFQKLNQLYLESSMLYEELSKFIQEYNYGLCYQNQRDLTSLKRWNKKQWKKFVRENYILKKISFEPELQEISIIFDLHDQSLRQIDQLLKQPKNRSFLQKAKQLRTKILKIPFEINEPIVKKLQEKMKLHGSGNLIEIEFNKKQDSVTKDNARILVESLRQNPQTVCIEQVKQQVEKLDKDSRDPSDQLILLKKAINECQNLQQNYHSLILKFIRKELFSQSEIEEVKWMIKSYQSQLIRIEVIENIATQYHMFQRLQEYPIGNQERNFITKSLAKSFNSPNLESNKQYSVVPKQSPQEKGRNSGKKRNGIYQITYSNLKG